MYKFVTLLLVAVFVIAPTGAGAASVAPVLILVNGVFDPDTGLPLNAGLAYFYAVGTTDAKDVYSDPAMGTVANNPVVLDATGSAVVYAYGNYKVIVTDFDGVVKRTYANIYNDVETDLDLHLNTLSVTGAVTLLSTLAVTGASTLGVVEATNLTAEFLNVINASDLTSGMNIGANALTKWKWYCDTSGNSYALHFRRWVTGLTFTDFLNVAMGTGVVNFAVTPTVAASNILTALTGLGISDQAADSNTVDGQHAAAFAAAAHNQSAATITSGQLDNARLPDAISTTGSVTVGGNLYITNSNPAFVIKDTSDYNGKVIIAAGRSGVGAFWSVTQNENNSSNSRFGSASNDEGLYWDTSELSLGINNDTPSAVVDVKSAIDYRDVFRARTTVGDGLLVDGYGVLSLRNSSYNAPIRVFCTNSPNQSTANMLVTDPGLVMFYGATTGASSNELDSRFGGASGNRGLYWDTSAVSLGINDDTPTRGMLDVAGTVAGNDVTINGVSVAWAPTISSGQFSNGRLPDDISTTSSVTVGTTLSATGLITGDAGMNLTGALTLVTTPEIYTGGSINRLSNGGGEPFLILSPHFGGGIELTLKTSGGIAYLYHRNAWSPYDTKDFKLFSLAANTGLYWDTSAVSLGINDDTPTYGLDVNGSFRTTGAATHDSTLSVSGTSTLAAVGATNLTASTSHTTGISRHQGASDFNAAVMMDSTLGVTGAVTLNGGLTMDTNKFTVADGTGNTYIDGLLGVGVAPAASHRITLKNSGSDYGLGTLLAGGTLNAFHWPWIGYAYAANGTTIAAYGGLKLTNTGNTASEAGGKLELQTAVANVLTTGFVLNDSSNVTLGATDLASTTSKLYVDGVVRVAQAFLGLGYNYLGAAPPALGADRLKTYLSSTDGGCAILFNDSTSAPNLTSSLYFGNRDSAGNGREHGVITGTCTDNTATSMDGKISIGTYSGGSAATAFIINDSQNVTLGATDLAGAGATAPRLLVDHANVAITSRTVTGGTGIEHYVTGGLVSNCGYPLTMWAGDSAGTKSLYGYARFNIVDNTAGSQSGNLCLYTANNGTSTLGFYIDDSQEIFFPNLSTTTATAANAVLESGQLKIVASLRSMKTNIRPIKTDWNKFMALNPVSFKAKADPTGPTIFGFLADEIEKVYKPLAVYANGKLQSVSYDRVPAVNTAAIQDLKRENDELKAQLKLLMKRVEKLERHK